MSETKKNNGKHEDANHKHADWHDQQKKCANTFKDMCDKFTKNIDKEAILSSHRKNVDSLMEANKMALDLAKSITQLQGQYMRQAFEDMNSMIREIMTNKFSVNNMQDHTKKIGEAVHKAVDHSLKVGNLFMDAHQSASSRIQEKMQNGAEDFKKYTSHFKH